MYRIVDLCVSKIILALSCTVTSSNSMDGFALYENQARVLRLTIFPTGSTHSSLYRMNAVIDVLFLCLAMVAYHCLPVHAFSGGAPFGACSTLSPDPVQHLANPQSSPVPYTIDLAVFDDGNGSFTYQPGMPYQREHKEICTLHLAS